MQECLYKVAAVIGDCDDGNAILLCWCHFFLVILIVFY
ncbi:hypothetical protein IMCC1989_883 [gamma proteobacterium IMCC1989]|nr:hypothetical protein IMCC1989_883 [gamma proteobacterium IMCC1989]